MESRQIHQFRSYGYNRSVEEVNSRWWTDSGLLVDPSSVSLPPIEIGPRDVSVSVSARLFFFRVPLLLPLFIPLSPSLLLESARIFVFRSSFFDLFPPLSLSLSWSPSAPPSLFRSTTIFCFHFFGKQSGGGGSEHQLFLAGQRGNNERR